ncbi:MAG: hypothetical protein ACREFC_00455, partial [Stellaceae bacterium]
MASLHSLRIANGIGLSVEIVATGRFQIADRATGWNFGGNVDGARRLQTASGRDRAGAWREIAFEFGIKGERRRAAIRLYRQRRIVLFELRFVDAGTTAETFPVLSRYPRGLHHLSYTGVFGRYSFRRFGPDGPWVFFDGDANAFILSPAAHFMNAELTRGRGGQLRSGIVATDKTLPAGFAHRTVLAVEPGINRAFDRWGNFLTDLAGKKRPANDAGAGLKYLGYWTDHGARYYYKPAPGADFPTTLLRVRDAFRDAGLGLGYVQLDSWFYRKGRKGEWRSKDWMGGGTYLYEAAPNLFPGGLPALRKKLGVPLVTHNRWIDAHSPYRKRYKISGNVATDPALWRRWMRYLKTSGVAIYEQDWFSKLAFPERTLADGERFMDGMAEAGRRENIDLQYCMALPRHFLQGTRYDNLTTIRPSGDRLREKHWRSFLFNGRLCTALGAWPWTDVFKSPETAHLILATLSAGMVGVGDTLGKFDWDNLRRAARADGVIVKPDTPLTPLDRLYVARAKESTAPIIAAARSAHGALTTTYLFAFGGSASVTPAELGYDTAVYCLDWFNDRGTLLRPSDAMRLRGNVSFWIVAPVGPSGVAFLGDVGKFASNGRQRVARLADDGTLRARIVLANGETRVRLHGWSRARPTFGARNGTVENLSYDSASGRFCFDLT